MRLEILLDNFASGIPDAEWIPQVSQLGWVALTHNWRIRYNRLERDTIIQSGSRVIVVSSGNTRAEMAGIFLEMYDKVIQFLRENEPPFIARLYSNRIEMWLNLDNWTP